MANISDFKSQLIGGGARPNQFNVQLTFPAFVGTGAAVGLSAQFLCKATTLPASTVENMQLMYRGRQVNFAGEKTFAPWSVTIYNDTTFLIRNAMEKWSDGIMNNARTNGITNPRDYQVDLLVNQLDRNGAVIKTYRLHDAYPSNVAAITLDYDSNNQIETFDVEFNYNYWTSVTSTGSITPHSDAVTAVAGLGGFPLPF
jgi:hypothetical protein